MIGRFWKNGSAGDGASNTGYWKWVCGNMDAFMSYCHMCVIYCCLNIKSTSSGVWKGLFHKQTKRTDWIYWHLSYDFNVFEMFTSWAVFGFVTDMFKYFCCWGYYQNTYVFSSFSLSKKKNWRWPLNKQRIEITKYGLIGTAFKKDPLWWWAWVGELKVDVWFLLF